MTYSSDVLGSLRLGQVCNPTVFQGTSQSSTAPAQGGGHSWRTRQPALSRNMERHADTQQPNFPQGSFGPQARLHGGSLQASHFHTLIRTGSACQTGHNLGGAVLWNQASNLSFSFLIIHGCLKTSILSWTFLRTQRCFDAYLQLCRVLQRRSIECCEVIIRGCSLVPEEETFKLRLRGWVGGI